MLAFHKYFLFEYSKNVFLIQVGACASQTEVITTVIT